MALQTSGEIEQAATLEENATLRRSVESAHGLLRSLRDRLSLQDQKSVDAALSDIALSPTSGSISSPLSENSKAELLASYPFRQPSTSAHRYLGEVSDISFFNSVKKVLQSNASDNRSGPQLESYERETTDHSETEDRFPESVEAYQHARLRPLS